MTQPLPQNFVAKFPGLSTATPVTVPLVTYVDGERKIIGEATIVEDQVVATLGEQAQELLDVVYGQGHFSIRNVASEETKFPALFDLGEFQKSLEGKIRDTLSKMNDTDKEENG